MAEVAIRRAPGEVIKLAQDLIDEHHEHLLEATVLWLFTTSKRTRGGHVVLGTAGRSNPLQRYLSSIGHISSIPADYIVQIDEGRWKRALATQRSALIDHLLCRMIQKETINRRTGETTKSWGTIGPDVEEFSSVIRRHGIWLPAQQIFAKAVRETGRTMEIKFPDLDAEPEEPGEDKPADNGKPPDRTTTVDDQGTVVATERVEHAPGAPTPGDAEGTPTPAVGDEASSDEASLSPSDSPPSTNGHLPSDGLEGTEGMPIPSWQEQTGIGSSEIEVHRQRRRRGTTTPEQVEAPS